MKEQMISKVMEAGGRLTVKSALNPILWLCGIVTVPTLITGSFYQQLPSWLIVLASSPVAVALFGFLFLLFFDRDKLQSEEYQLRKRTLELTQQKDQPFPIEANLKEVIENPNLRSLTNSGENE